MIPDTTMEIMISNKEKENMIIIDKEMEIMTIGKKMETMNLNKEMKVMIRINNNKILSDKLIQDQKTFNPKGNYYGKMRVLK